MNKCIRSVNSHPVFPIFLIGFYFIGCMLSIANYSGYVRFNEDIYGAAVKRSYLAFTILSNILYFVGAAPFWYWAAKYSQFGASWNEHHQSKPAHSVYNQYAAGTPGGAGGIRVSAATHTAVNGTVDAELRRRNILIGLMIIFFSHDLPLLIIEWNMILSDGWRNGLQGFVFVYQWIEFIVSFCAGWLSYTYFFAGLIQEHFGGSADYIGGGQGNPRYNNNMNQYGGRGRSGSRGGGGAVMMVDNSIHHNGGDPYAVELLDVRQQQQHMGGGGGGGPDGSDYYRSNGLVGTTPAAAIAAAGSRAEYHSGRGGMGLKTGTDRVNILPQEMPVSALHHYQQQQSQQQPQYQQQNQQQQPQRQQSRLSNYFQGGDGDQQNMNASVDSDVRLVAGSAGGGLGAVGSPLLLNTVSPLSSPSGGIPTLTTTTPIINQYQHQQQQQQQQQQHQLQPQRSSQHNNGIGIGGVTPVQLQHQLQKPLTEIGGAPAPAVEAPVDWYSRGSVNQNQTQNHQSAATFSGGNNSNNLNTNLNMNIGNTSPVRQQQQQQQHAEHHQQTNLQFSSTNHTNNPPQQPQQHHQSQSRFRYGNGNGNINSHQGQSYDML